MLLVFTIVFIVVIASSYDLITTANEEDYDPEEDI